MTSWHRDTFHIIAFPHKCPVVFLSLASTCCWTNSNYLLAVWEAMTPVWRHCRYFSCFQLPVASYASSSSGQTTLKVNPPTFPWIIPSLWFVLAHFWPWLLRSFVLLTMSRGSDSLFHGPLSRYVKLRVAHAPGMPGTFSPPPTSMETTSWRSRHASRHVRHARAVMHVRSLTRGSGENVPGIPGACATRNSTYLVRDPRIGQSPVSAPRSYHQERCCRWRWT